MKKLFIAFYFLVSTELVASPAVTGLIPIESIYNLDRSELAPFAERMKDKKIIGLGEVIHGTHSAHAMRLQIIKFLVEDYGFRLIAFESPWLSAEKTNEFVHKGGSIQQAQRALTFYAWADRSVTELLKWARKFNEAHPTDQVSIFGIDMQGSDEDRAFLINKMTVDSQLTHLKGRVSQCLTSSDYPVDESFQKRRLKCQKALKSLVSIINKMSIDKKTLLRFKLAASSLSAFQDELHALKISHNLSLVHKARDPSMVANLELMRDYYGPEKKAIFYAHNAHIAKATHELPNIYGDARLAGTLLADMYQEGYAAVGAISYVTEINQDLFKGWQAVSPTPAGSLEYDLNLMGNENLLIDLKSEFIPQGQKFWIHNNGQMEVIVPSHQYDFLFFSKYSPPLIVSQ